MNDLISRKALLAEYDRVHIGEPGKARKLIEDAPRAAAVEVEELKIRCAEIKELKHFCDRLRDENSKLGIQYEQLLKEKSNLDRQMRYLEGQVEAYKFIWGYRKEM